MTSPTSTAALKSGIHLTEVERRQYHLERPGFRISEMTLSPTQSIPWHSHSDIGDTFYVIEGHLHLFLRDPEEQVHLRPGQSYPVTPGRPHHVTNGGETSMTILVLQGVGTYDYVPLD